VIEFVPLVILSPALFETWLAHSCVPRRDFSRRLWSEPNQASARVPTRHAGVRAPRLRGSAASWTSRFRLRLAGLSRFAIAFLGILLLGFQSGSAAVKLNAQKLADGFDAASAGLAAADIDVDGKPEIIAWSANGVKVLKNGSKNPVDCGLGAVQDVISIAPGDFNNDGLPDLAILTKSGAELWANRNGMFEKRNVFIPEGPYNKAIWADYDHDGDLDLFLLGDKSVLLRNDGAAGFTDVHNNFPFVAGRAVDGAMIDRDLVVIYSDRPGVLYMDKMEGRYEAQDLNVIPAGAKSIAAADRDLIVTTDSGIFPIFNRRGSFERGTKITPSPSALALVDLENRGRKDIAVSGSIFRNEGSGKSSETKFPVLDAVALVAVDFDGDGRTDLVEVQHDGSLVFLRNEM
jgi:hypothetical protein